MPMPSNDKNRLWNLLGDLMTAQVILAAFSHELERGEMVEEKRFLKLTAARDDARRRIFDFLDVAWDEAFSPSEGGSDG